MSGHGGDSGRRMESFDALVLLVDDEPGFADMVGDVLERDHDGLAVITTTSPSDGLQRLARNPVDAVISDYEMPQMDGLEFLAAVRERNPSIPFLLFTGKGSEEIASEAISNDVTDYLRKDSDTAQYTVLGNRVVNAIERARTEREIQHAYTAIETAHEGISVLDEDGRFTYVNDAYADLYGYEPSDLLGDHWEVLYHDEDVADIRDNVLPTVNEEGHWEGETRGKCYDGTTIVEEHGLSITDDGGLVCAVQDITARKERERTLQRSQRRFEAILNSPTSLIAILDPDGTVLEVNETATGMIDIDSDDIIGHPFWETPWWTHSPPLQQELQTSIERAATGQHVRIETDLTLDGDEVVIAGVIRPVTDATGTVVSLIAEGRDVTDRKQRERDLQASKERFQTLFDQSADAIFLHDATGSVDAVNQRACDQLGYTAAELQDNPVWDIATYGDPVAVRERWASMEPDDVATFTGVHRRKDGSTYPVQVHTSVVEYADQRQFIATVRDVSAQQNRERILTALHDVAVDLGTLNSVEAICERTIAASQELLEFDLSVIDMEDDGYLSKVALSEEIPPEDTKTMSIEEGIAGKTYRTGEPLIVDDVTDFEEANPQGPYRSGVSVPIGRHGVFQAVADAPGAFDESDLELAKLLLSHTESAISRVERERQLEHQNKRLEEFASIVSHDLRNPLSIAMGQLDLATETHESVHLDTVARAHSRMEALINDLLTLAREGDKVQEFEPVDLAEISESCWQNVMTDGATLATDTTRRISADRSRVQQLLENLFRNAIEHAGHDVTVRIGELTEAAGFFVADDGPGIPSDEYDQVFESGFTTLGNNTGFGLTIVTEIADAHDWEVRVTGGPDGGARFEITGVEFADS